MELPLPSRQRAATAWAGGATAVLHDKAALQFAEKRAYRDLLHAIQLRPALAQQKDDFAMTPLHWVATDHAVPLRVLQHVVLAFPEAASARNLAGLLPIHMAVRKDLPLDALKTLLKFYPNAIVAETPDGKSVVEIANTCVTSQSTRLFLSMLEDEVRSLGAHTQQHSQTSNHTSTSTNTNHSDHRHKQQHHQHQQPTSEKTKSEQLRTWGWSDGDEHLPSSSSMEQEESSPSSLSFASQRTMDEITMNGLRPLPPIWKHNTTCHMCDLKFGYFKNRHHCRNCGESVCGRHSKHSVPLKHLGLFHPQRVCSGCYARMQAHYTSRAIDRLSPHHGRRADRHHRGKKDKENVFFEDTLPQEYAYSPRGPHHHHQQQQQQRQTRSRSVFTISAEAANHHPLLSPRHFQQQQQYHALQSPSPSPRRSPPQQQQQQLRTPPPPQPRQPVALPTSTRTMRSATLSPSNRTISSSNTERSGVSSSSAATSSSGYHQTTHFVKTPSAMSMYISHVQRADDHQDTVLDRQREMQRRRDRPAKTDLDTSSTSQRPLLPHQQQQRDEWGRRDSDGSRSRNNQSSNDDHELQMELQMEKLLLAKKQISDALKRSKRDASHAQAQKVKYDRLAKEFEDRGYPRVVVPSSVSHAHDDHDNHLAVDAASTVNDSGTELGDALTSPGSTSTATANHSLGGHSSEDNQQEHEREHGSPVVSCALYDLQGGDGDDGQDEHTAMEHDDGGVYGIVPDTTPRETVVVGASPFQEKELDFSLDHAATHHDLGAALLTKGDFAKAAQELQQSLDLEPSNALAWYHFAKALDGKGDSHAAESAIQKSLQLEANSLPSLSLLGKLLNARGEHDQAIVVFRRALNLQQCPSPNSRQTNE